MIKVGYYNDVVYSIELANRLYDFDIQRDARSKKISVMRDNDGKSQANSNRQQSQNKTLMTQEKEPSYYFDKKSQIIAQKSLNPDGKVLDREDLGLAPLEQIKQKLESTGSKKKRLPFLNKPRKLETEQALINDQNSHTVSHLLGKIGNHELQNDEIADLNQSGQNHKEKAKQNTIEDSAVFQKKLQNQMEMSQVSCKIDNLEQNQTEYFKTSPPIDSISPNLIPMNLSLMIKQSIKKFSQEDHNLKGLEQDLKQAQLQVSTPIQRKRQTTDKVGGGQDPNAFLDKELRFIIQRDRSLKPSIKYILNKLSCGKLFNNEVVQMLNKADDMIKKDLDIFTILERIKELEKFKKLIFTQEQMMLFNFFPKPLIHIDKQQKHITRQNMKEEETEKQLKSLRMLQKRSKILKINKGNLGAIYKAVIKLKKLNRKNTLTEYQQLYECYQKIQTESQNQQFLLSIKQIINFNIFIFQILIPTPFHYQNESNQYELLDQLNILSITQKRAEYIFNQKLIDLLGDEMKNIFEITQMMKDRQNEREQSMIGQSPFNLNDNTFSEDPSKFKMLVPQQQKSVFNRNYKENNDCGVKESIQNLQAKQESDSQKDQQSTKNNIEQNLEVDQADNADQIIIFDENETESNQSQ